MVSLIYDIDGDFGGTVFCSRLHSDIQSDHSIHTKCTGVSVGIPDEGQVKIDFDSQLTSTEQAALALIVAEHNKKWLDENKKRLYKDIDAEIERRIRSGFQVNTKQFSLSVNAQLKWAGLVVSKDMIPYPLRVPTIDDQDYIDIQDANEVVGMWTSAVGTVKYHIGEGTDAKENVKAAPDWDSAVSIFDTYMNG